MMAKKVKPKVASDVDRLIGQRVRQLRMQLGMSQEELGKGAGITFQQIQKYEKGTNRLSVNRMLQFVELLQTTPNDIIGWKAGNVTAINGFSGPTFEAAREFSDFPEEVQIALRRMCGVLADTLKKKR